MALTDLLEAIRADADADRNRLDRETAAEAAAIVDRARQEAGAVEADLAARPEAEARAEGRRACALARLDAANAVRSAREAALAAVLESVRSELAGLRGTGGHDTLFRSLLDESRAALPGATELRVDPRDVELATASAPDLHVVPMLDTSAGLELACSDGRTVRNTVEERLDNADLLLRQRFACWLEISPELESAPAL
jgi:vacuolar-type H+-ATPase subunit E/Vma4